MTLHVRVYGEIGECDFLEFGSNVFPEEIRGGLCWPEEKEDLKNEKGT